MSDARTNEEQGFYRVQLSANHAACTQCGHGSYYTIVYNDENGEETEIGQAWGDQEIAEDICDLMNMAYDAGRESPEEVYNAEEMKLVEFFRSPEGDKLGRDGDHDELTPAETAIRAMRHLTALEQVSK